MLLHTVHSLIAYFPVCILTAKGKTNSVFIFYLIVNPGKQNSIIFENLSVHFATKTKEDKCLNKTENNRYICYC